MGGFIILIAGIPGTGKTTFAAYLSAQLRIPMISKDIVKEQLYDAIGFKSRAEKVALGAAALRVMHHFAASSLSADRPIILENNYEASSKPELLQLIEGCQCRVLAVVFHCDPRIALERIIQRDQSPGRHRGHVVNTQYPEVAGQRAEYAPPSTSVAEFTAAMERRGMLNFDIGDDIVEVDTSDFSRVSYADILARVRSILENYGCEYSNN